MSSDAQVRRGETGWQWTGTHDGVCALPVDHAEPLPLSEKLKEVEDCMGQSLRWEVDDHWTDGTVRLRGWHA